jgi:hypothetical protein
MLTRCASKQKEKEGREKELSVKERPTIERRVVLKRPHRLVFIDVFGPQPSEWWTLVPMRRRQ